MKKESIYTAWIDNQNQILKRLIPTEQLTQLWGPHAPLFLKQLWAYTQHELAMGSIAINTKPVIDRLTKGERILAADVLASLAARANKSPTKQVQRARTILTSFFSQPDTQAFLATRNYIPLVGGSIQYSDPINLEADVLLITERPLTQKDEKAVVITLTDSLIGLWGREDIGEEPHVSVFSLADFSQKTFIRNPRKWVYQTDNTNLALTGMPILSQDNAYVSTFRQKVLTAIHESPVATAITNEHLAACLAIRIARSPKP